jgi:hypothetical protein
LLFASRACRAARFSGVRFGVEDGKIAAAMAAYSGQLLSYSQSLARQFVDVVLSHSFVITRIDTAKEKHSWPKTCRITRWAIAQHFNLPM